MLREEHDGEDSDLQKVSYILLYLGLRHPGHNWTNLLLSGLKVDREQAELLRANFSILKKEAQGILDLVGVLFP